MWPIGLGDPFMTIFSIVHTPALFVVLFSSFRLHIIDLFNFFLAIMRFIGHIISQAQRC